MNERRQDFEQLQRFTRQGEQSAFAEVVRRHLDLVFATALRKLEDPGAAHEVSQNVFAALGRKAWQFAPDDYGSLWEHLTLEHLQAHLPDTPIRYWRDKAGNEIDFVLPRARDSVDAIECKWNPNAFDASALNVFRSYYPKGRNYLVTPLEGPAYARRFGNLELTVCEPDEVED